MSTDLEASDGGAAEALILDTEAREAHAAWHRASLRGGSLRVSQVLIVFFGAFGLFAQPPHLDLVVVGLAFAAGLEIFARRAKRKADLLHDVYKDLDEARRALAEPRPGTAPPN